MRRLLPLALLAAAALANAAPAYAGARFVGSRSGFQRAVSDFRLTGGRIILLPGDYRGPLAVGPRSNSPLEIVGSQGTRVQTLDLIRTQAVTVRNLVVRPLDGKAGIVAERSHDIVFRGDTFTAKHTHSKVGLRLDFSRSILVRNSNFSHCGDRTPKWSTCLLPRWAARVRIVHNWFHDCRGCDFIGGRAGPHVVIRENRFDRALACHTGWVKCAHQDLIELFRADGLLITRNVFGVSQGGGGQVNLATGDDDVRIVNNLFLRDDPLAPGIVARVGILAGTRATARIPLRLEVVNNTILSGAPKGHHAASSIVLSPHYANVLRRNRPLIANNVIAQLMDSGLVCGRDRDSIQDVVAAGTGCSQTDAVGDPMLDADGRPTPASTMVIDLADPTLAPPVDIDGTARVGPPDIGAYEFSG
jgi:Right handed beta helix region